MPQRPSDAAASFQPNYQGILGSSVLGKLALLVDIPEVQADVVGRCAEQLGHLPLRQPDGLVLEPHVETHLAVGRLVEDDLAAIVFRGLIHAPLTLASAPTRHKDGDQAALVTFHHRKTPPLTLAAVSVAPKAPLQTPTQSDDTLHQASATSGSILRCSFRITPLNASRFSPIAARGTFGSRASTLKAGPNTAARSLL